MNSLIERLNSDATLSNIIDKVNELIDLKNQELKEYININKESGNFSEQSLSSAILLVPTDRRLKGIRVRFIETSQGWNEYIWEGGQWNDLTTWTKETINGGDWI